MKALEGRHVLVTGANGGLGEQFVAQALERGAAKVYAAARTPRTWSDPRVEPLDLDLNDPEAPARAAAVATDVDLLINNAAIAPAGDSISGPEDELRRIFETNFFGTLRVSNAFAPVLAANGGGTLINILSAAAWVSMPTGYAASKAAMWSATNALRLQLRGQGTHVVGLLVGMIDTPMTAGWDVPKVTPESVVAQAYDAVGDGTLEVLADEVTRDLKSRLNTRGEELYPWLDEQVAALSS
ncbi:SDR family oxidoreductase [Microlunatus antarcticus]|uniref:NAD(P)-dependent dehydrogenase (Short-subunit alcohol dehydrogenase family) n=1 Tax=Microlunatus antarcticus TaxID=53388 RepID=A0A7W5JXW1_9ACTN|nr:SDR family oxidoreductase [Microlunatus antarcticus]MBB3328136.1 NAD(P)-dependent dehydrogenase (short-subunit alcohol dehydrogenase family) [Microlunatus antarcticus]